MNLFTGSSYVPGRLVVIGKPTPEFFLPACSHRAYLFGESLLQMRVRVAERVSVVRDERSAQRTNLTKTLSQHNVQVITPKRCYLPCCLQTLRRRHL